jgi:hypothetical protein
VNRSEEPAATPVGGLTANQVFQVQIRETIRSYVCELAGWDKNEVHAALMDALALIERAKHDQDLADALLAAKPKDLDDLLHDSLVDPITDED